MQGMSGMGGSSVQSGGNTGQSLASSRIRDYGASVAKRSRVRNYGTPEAEEEPAEAQRRLLGWYGKMKGFGGYRSFGGGGSHGTMGGM